jgi:hypothetical protein
MELCLFVRKYAYEFFLIMHIVLSVIVIVACWYHPYDLHRFLGGYQIWLYATPGVWFFNHLVRIVRILVEGPRRAKVTEIGDEDVRVNVPELRWGADPGKHVYVYLPTLHKFRPWTNPAALLTPSSSRPVPDTRRRGSNSDIEKPTVQVTSTPHPRTSTDISLYIRNSAGMTPTLRETNNILIPLEGRYPINSTKAILRCDSLLLIGDGMGITAFLPSTISNYRNAKLAWSVREAGRCLVTAFSGILDTIADKKMKIGSWLNVAQLLSDEAEASWDRVGVVVSGSGELCNVARQAVVDMARRDGRTEC